MTIFNTIMGKKGGAPDRHASITVSKDGNGTITPFTGELVYPETTSPTITATPDSGYVISSVVVDGLEQTSKPKDYTFNNISGNHSYFASFILRPIETHTVYIDKSKLSQTQPYSGTVYYESGYDATQAYNWIMSKIHPSVVKNGTVNYFLDKSDLTKKLDGTASKLDGTDGDVMMSIEPLWWKVLENSASRLAIQISEAPISGGVTAHLFNGTVRKYLHMGMFKMCKSSAISVYSTSEQPWTNMTNDTARTTAENRGATYDSTTGLTWALYQNLVLFTSGSVNSQETVGKDLTNGSKSAVSTSAMLTANGYTSSTKTSDTTSLMYLFLANPWGNVRDWICGFKSVGGVWKIINDQSQARGVSVDASTPSTWSSLTYPNNSSGWISDVQGVDAAPLMFKTVSGSDGKYYCDYGYANSSGNKCAYVGGDYSSGSNAGVFCMYADSSSSSAGGYIGARLQCLDTEVYS